jgi:hypothetical protein
MGLLFVEMPADKDNISGTPEDHDEDEDLEKSTAELVITQHLSESCEGQKRKPVKNGLACFDYMHWNWQFSPGRHIRLLVGVKTGMFGETPATAIRPRRWRSRR